MPRKRTIDPGIWTSDSFNALTYRQRLLFVNLFSMADDWGRGPASPSALKMRAFPMDPVSREDMAGDLEAIAHQDMALIFTHQSKPFYELPAWEVQQSMEWRAKKRTIPTPQESNTGYIENKDITSTLLGSTKPTSGGISGGISRDKRDERVKRTKRIKREGRVEQGSTEKAPVRTAQPTTKELPEPPPPRPDSGPPARPNRGEGFVPLKGFATPDNIDGLKGLKQVLKDGGDKS